MSEKKPVKIHKDDMKLCIQVAQLLAQRSRATRCRVGCVIWHVKKRSIISLGYNGTPAGVSNVMEKDGKTLDNVIHAEINAIQKLYWWERRKQLVMVITHSPCLACAQAIVKRGIKICYYISPYGGADAIKYLRDHGVNVVRILEE